MSKPLRVDVWSDLVCPWCHIALHRLRRVAREHGQDLEVVHHAYQLDPGRESSGPTRDYLAQRYGAQNVDAMFASAERAAATEGLNLKLADTISCNTWDGHRLVALAATRGLQDAMVVRLMRAHFEEHQDLGKPEVLARLATEVGLPAAEVGPVLAGDGMGAHVEEDVDQARSMGVRGVPFFVFDGRFAFSGAQPDAAFAEAFRLAAAPPAPPASP